MRISGIYKIQSIIKPERIYVGSAIYIDRRWYSHLNLLKKNKHPNRKLQNHYNKYREADLQFSVLLGCEKEYLIANEQFFIDSYKPWFNLRPKADSNLGCKMSEETIEKMKLRIVSEETKQKLKNFNTGKHHKESTKQKCRDYRHTEEAKNLISLAGIGRGVSEKSLKKLLERRCIKVRDTRTGIIYPSINSAALQFGIKRRTLENMLHGTNGICKVRNKTNLKFYKEAV